MSASQVTEAHIALSNEVLFKHSPAPSFVGASALKAVAQLIADSEAKAVEQTNAQVESLLSAAKNAIPASEHPAEPTVQNWAWQIRNLGDDRRLVYAERDKLRADVERLKSDGAASAFITMSCRASRAETDRNNLRADLDAIKAILNEEKGRAELAEAEVSKLTDALDMMRDEFTRIIACPGCNAEIEDLANRAQLKLIQRVPVITQRDRAEAELKEWSLLNLWVGAPEIIHAFIKGQQARIHAAQDLECELESTKERALTLANLLDQAQTELAELKESVLVQQIFSDDRIRANAAEAELAKERARLDWMDNYGYENGANVNEWAIALPENQKSNTRNLRAAIDAAMKEGA